MAAKMAIVHAANAVSFFSLFVIPPYVGKLAISVKTNIVRTLHLAMIGCPVSWRKSVNGQR